MLKYEIRPSDLEKDALPWWVTTTMRRQLIACRRANKNTIVSADSMGRVELRDGIVTVVDRTNGERAKPRTFVQLLRESKGQEVIKKQAGEQPAANAPHSNTKISRPPGHIWVALLSFVYSQRTYDHVFAPHIADMRKDHAEALQAGETKKAKWIAVRDNVR